jgi:hypothetical protein
MDGASSTHEEEEYIEDFGGNAIMKETTRKN